MAETLPTSPRAGHAVESASCATVSLPSLPLSGWRFDRAALEWHRYEFGALVETLPAGPNVRIRTLGHA